MPTEVPIPQFTEPATEQPPPAASLVLVLAATAQEYMRELEALEAAPLGNAARIARVRDVLRAIEPELRAALDRAADEAGVARPETPAARAALINRFNEEVAPCPS